jgi:23S rRNA (cytidine1920-2'-O)/16S rRNA (cytidine1409-2'-O)-methyltransferase
VTVDRAPALKPTTLVHDGQSLRVAPPPARYASRGGEKLEAALDHFGIDPSGRLCLDAGSSTGGFTDCLLQHGARHVIAVDVGYGQIADRLRRDTRVTVLERTNIRELRPDALPDPGPDLVTCDLSFISLRLVLAPLRAVAHRPAEAVLLVKPQFEAARDEVEPGGVVRSALVWRRVLGEVAMAAEQVGWRPVGAMVSPLVGPAGNVEFLLHLSDCHAGPDGIAEHLDDVVGGVQQTGADQA